MITTSLLSLFIDIIKTGRDCFHWFQPLNGGNPIYVYIYTVNNNMRYMNSTSNIGIGEWDKISLPIRGNRSKFIIQRQGNSDARWQELNIPIIFQIVAIYLTVLNFYRLEF